MMKIFQLLRFHFLGTCLIGANMLSVGDKVCYDAIYDDRKVKTIFQSKFLKKLFEIDHFSCSRIYFLKTFSQNTIFFFFVFLKFDYENSNLKNTKMQKIENVVLDFIFKEIRVK